MDLLSIVCFFFGIPGLIVGLVLAIVGGLSYRAAVRRYGRPLDWRTTGRLGWLVGRLRYDEVDGWSLVDRRDPKRAVALRGPLLDAICYPDRLALVIGRLASHATADGGAFRGSGAPTAMVLHVEAPSAVQLDPTEFVSRDAAAMHRLFVNGLIVGGIALSMVIGAILQLSFA